MSFGKKKKSSSSNTVKVRPTNFYSDFGDVHSSLRSVRLKNETPEAVQQGMNIAGVKERDILQGLPSSVDPNQLFNNPYVDALKQQLMGDFDVRERDQRQDLTRQLARRNSLGNSAGMYALAQQQQGANRQRSNINAQAMLGGADAFSQNLGNMLSVLQNVQRSRLANIEQSFAPAKLAAGFQSALNPLITADANAKLAQQSLQNQAQRSSGLFGSLGGLVGGLI